MLSSEPTPHIYARDINQSERTSLNLLVAHIAPQSTVLDLGCGTGALGRWLQANGGCTIDGVTLSDQEASAAKTSYRTVAVDNLDTVDLATHFGQQRYDFIVCADVLEHLANPARILAQCRSLLAPNGALLVSVPNASYAGLIAELMQGRFDYRDEGLLDRTHLRFFTQATLLEFLNDNGWPAQSLECVHRELHESEFSSDFDQLPPTVARHLLSQPNALTYQLVTCSRPGAPAAALPIASATEQARFSSELFIDTGKGYSEDTKLTATGVIGQEHQTLTFQLPAQPGYQRIRLDPSNRCGFLHLHAIRLVDTEGTTTFEWTANQNGAHQRLCPNGLPSQHIQLLWNMPGFHTPSPLLVMFGEDPWLEIPITPAILQAAGAKGAQLQVDVGWPMSADYLVAAHGMAQLKQRIEQLDMLCQQQERFTREQQQRAQENLERQRQEQEKILQEQAAQFFRDQQQLAQEQQQHIEQLTQDQLRLTQAQQQQFLREQQLREQEKANLQAQLQRTQQDAAQTIANLSSQYEVAQQEYQALQQQSEALQKNLRQRNEELQQTLHQRNAHLQQARQNLEREYRQLKATHQATQTQLQQLQQHLQWIENSNVFRMTRPLVNFKMWLRDALSTSPEQPTIAAPAPAPLGSPVNPIPPTPHPVDVIVPVYKGLADTQLCITSALASVCTTPMRLIVINDASPEPEVTAWLRHIATTDARIVLLENAENLGFVGTVNRGMSHSTDNDVLLLNSDTEVANNWLDRLRAAAYSDLKVGSVTPFSNNATICSYPRFCTPNPLVDGQTTASLDALCSQLHAGLSVDVPTGIGFCMYIRRACLEDVGLFDVANFGKGYGEENDFCRRAHYAGWRNLHALDTFVLHSGGVSFGASKSARELAAMETLRRLHPTYEAAVMRFIEADPAQPFRHRLDMARLANSPQPTVLAISHNRGGGTLRHVHELADTLRDKAHFLTLIPIPGGKVALELYGSYEGFKLEFAIPEQWQELLSVLRSIRVRQVHIHHTLGHHPQVMGVAQALGIPFDFTAHDHYTYCPQISLTQADNRYCGEQGPQQCHNCLEKSPAPGGADIATWRSNHIALLHDARHILAPSRDTAGRMAKLLPLADVRFAPHTDIDTSTPLPQPSPQPRATSTPLKVLVIGAMSVIKGADVLEAVAIEAARTGAPLDLHLIGYAYRDLKKRPHANLTVHGAYQEDDLPGLLAWLAPDVVWFPAQWPETYSYTMSACLQAGLPIVAPDVGAFPERLHQRPWSWVMPWDSSTNAWLQCLNNVHYHHFVTGTPPTPPTVATPASGIPVKAWDYDHDYLSKGKSTSVTSTTNPSDAQPVDIPSADWLHGYRAGQIPPGIQAITTQARSTTLSILLHLRSAPGLRLVAQKIPARWQTRVKNWLVR